MQTVGAVVGILTASAVALGSFLWWRAERSRELWVLLRSIRAFLADEVIAPGGAEASAFMTDERKAEERELEDVLDRLHDKKLRKHVSAALESYKDAFTFAPPRERDIQPTADERRVSADRAARFERQRESAGTALTEIAAARDRLNQLERFLIRKSLESR